MANGKVRARKKGGLAGAPTKSGFPDFRAYVQHEVDGKELTESVKNYVKREYSKPDAIAILANAQHTISLPILGCICYWSSLGNKFEGQWSNAINWMTIRFEELIISGDTIVRENMAKKKVDDAKFVITPAMKARNVAVSTIVQDFYDIEDLWLKGEPTIKTKYNLYKQMTIHDIRVFEDIEGWINEHLDDYKLFIKKDEYILEAYSHLTAKTVRDRVKFLKALLDDVESFKNSKRAVRTIKVKKPKAADKQVERLNYLKDNPDYKLTSTNPMHIPGSMNVFTFNIKNKQLTMFVSDSPDGMQVTGSTIKKFSTEHSVVTTLRKPSDVLPAVLKKTPKQITKLLESLTTKKGIPTGRINKDTIILRCK